jgi:hypothetical protein
MLTSPLCLCIFAPAVFGIAALSPTQLPTDLSFGIRKFENALTVAVGEATETTVAQVRRAVPSANVTWERSETVAFELSSSSEMVVVIRIPTLLLDQLGDIPRPIPYFERVVQAIVDTVINKSELLPLERIRRVTIVAWTPRDGRPERVPQVHVSAQTRDLLEFYGDRLSREEVRLRITVEQQVDRVNVRRGG